MHYMIKVGNIVLETVHMFLEVKLPEILHDAKIEEETLLKLQPKILDLLKFLQKNQGTLFLSTYQTPEDLDTEMKNDIKA
ncbi:hypothetical protein AgCh_014819 [Apium graveolens]